MREYRAGGLETLDLRLIEGIAGDLGRDEMAHQQVGPARAPCISIAHFSRARESKPSRFMPVSRWIAQGTDPIPTRGEGGPARELLFAADRGREAMLGIVRRIGPALEAVEHIDRGLRRQHPPRRDPFAEMGDEEDARARGPQRRRGFGDAGPVSIGLDDGGATAGGGAARKVAPVVGQRAKVDPKPHRRARGRDRVRQPKRSWVPNLHARM